MCPVRALKIYVHLTLEVTGQIRALFVLFDRSHSPLCRWRTDVIRQAYTSTIFRKDLPVCANPFSVRGVATSWAEFA